MKITTRSVQGDWHFPNTVIYQQLDNQMTIFLRCWGSSDTNQKALDEITQYLSTTQADIEFTTPFDYVESLSSLANRTRVSILLAHDAFYKSNNKMEYNRGFEVLVLFRNRHEIAWSSVGRFGIQTASDVGVNTVVNVGSDLDGEVLLPPQLIGLEKELNIVSGSIAVRDSLKLLVTSTYLSEARWIYPENGVNGVEMIPSRATYWYSVIEVG